MATKQLCTITFIEDEDGVDVLVTSHPNGNDLEKLAKSVLEAVEALVKRHDPPNTPMDREPPLPVRADGGLLQDDAP
jgi:hypothetical protein